MKDLVVYVAGPYRAKPDPANQWQQEQNIREAETLALDVWRLGVAAICPHTNTRHYQGAAPDDVWLAGDLAILKRCDAVLCTPRWEESSGARAEVVYALQHSKPVLFTIGELKDWLELWTTAGVPDVIA